MAGLFNALSLLRGHPHPPNSRRPRSVKKPQRMRLLGLFLTGFSRGRRTDRFQRSWLVRELVPQPATTKRGAFREAERMLEPPDAPMSRTDDRNFRKPSDDECDARSRIQTYSVRSICHCTEDI